MTTRSTSRGGALLAALVASTVSLHACAEPDDANPDAALDAGRDAGLDAGRDAGNDVDASVGLDAGLDVDADVGLDAGLDADVGRDAGEDAGSDAGAEPGGDGGLDASTPEGLATLCAATPDDARCAPPGTRCAVPQPLRALSWVTPRNWPDGSAPAGSPIVAAEEIAVHQAGNPSCDWRTNNSDPGCAFASGHGDPLREPLVRNLDELAARLLARPEGHRALVWRSWSNETLPHLHPSDVTIPGASGEPAQPGLWWDAGADETSESVRAVLRGLATRGVTVDWLVIDLEWNLSNWSIGTCDSSDPTQRAREISRWNAIAEDPRTPALLAEWSSRFGVDLTREFRADLCPMAYGAERYLAWNAFMQERVAAYCERAFVDVARAIFPAIRISNYEFSHSDPAVAVPDMNGHDTMRFGRGAIVGTHQSPACYGILGQVSTRIVPRISDTAIYARTPFNAVRFAINEYRARALARPDVPVAPWVAPQDYVDEGRAAHGGTPLWAELMLHLGASAPDVLLYWNNSITPSGDVDAAFEAALREVNRVVGCASRATAVRGLAPWDAPWLVSGLSVDGRRVWRFTPEDETTALVREGRDLVAQQGTRRFVFPDAWALPAVAPFTRGTWVMQAEGAASPREE
jgi:hypothetical protein